MDQLERRTFLRIAAATTAVAASPTLLGDPAAAVVARVGKPAVPRGRRAYLGAYEYRDSFLRGISNPEALERALGTSSDPRRFTINHCFRLVDETPGAWEQLGTAWAPLRERFLRDKAAGRIPMLSWAAGAERDTMAARVRRLREISGGYRDARINGQAAALRDLRTPVFLRWTWEFDQRYHGHAEEWKRAWIHVRRRFEQMGARNVAFVWCPTRNAFNHDGAAEARRFWPGVRYVDWVGCDGYSRATDPQSFFSLFAGAHRFSVAKGLPLMVAETGVERTVTTPQRAWLDGLTKNLDDGRFPNLKALVLYHRDTEVDWRLDQPPGRALSGLRTLAAHPRLVTR